jgi:hypothetical protein
LDKKKNAICVIKDLGLPFRDKVARLWDSSGPKYQQRERSCLSVLQKCHEENGNVSVPMKGSLDFREDLIIRHLIVP